ncbi:MAG: hypothetical protein ABS942_12555 [Solibacillus sp.]
MKKIVLPFLISLLLVGCNGKLGNNVVIEPRGLITANGERYEMMPFNYEWKENNMERKPLRTPDRVKLADDFETLEAEKGDTLKFEIDKNPPSVEVIKENEDGTIERVEMKDNKIILPSKEGYYIYELKAKWDKGKITFLFDVNVN